jgi:hypothetical protein
MGAEASLIKGRVHIHNPHCIAGAHNGRQVLAFVDRVTHHSEIGLAQIKHLY